MISEHFSHFKSVQIAHMMKRSYKYKTDKSKCKSFLCPSWSKQNFFEFLLNKFNVTMLGSNRDFTKGFVGDGECSVIDHKARLKKAIRGLVLPLSKFFFHLWRLSLLKTHLACSPVHFIFLYFLEFFSHISISLYTF